MSLLPGLGLTEPEEAAKAETTTHHLVKESEWRFEIAASKYIQVKVSRPLASTRNKSANAGRS
jgi:hypothetical protein